tara:strand:+ start:2719 stop:3297 length:579 start_codon:yes stop_codon:yes gene_type:complete
VLFFVKTILFSLLLFVLTFKAAAEEFWRLRYFLPYSTENEITRNFKKSKKNLRTNGHGSNFIFANGIGLGYCTLLTNGIIEGVYYKFKNHSLNLSYTLGSSLSFTLGVGKLINGRGELNYNGKNFVTEKSTGESFFSDLGVPFFGGEFIIGYRQNFTEYNNFQTQISEESIVLDDTVKLHSSQFNVGLGLLF